jgi:hypothetical protein
MSQPTGFIEEGFAAMRAAVVETMDRVGRDFKPALSRRLAQSIRAQIRLIETMLRRLLVLLAAETELNPPAPAGPAPRTRAPYKAMPRGFQIAPQTRYDAGALEKLRAEGANRAGQNCTATAPLLHRLTVLLRHLDHPVPLARRMGRMLEQQKADGDPRPIVMAQAGLHRLHHRIALVAEVLPEKVNTALRQWFDSG